MKNVYQLVRRYILATLLLLGTGYLGMAQVKIGDNPTTISSSAILDLESTTKGLLPPRMTTAQRNAISNPAQGLLVYNITKGCLEINLGSSGSPNWQCLAQMADNSSNGTASVSAYGGAGCTGNGSITGSMTQGTPVSGVTMTIYANVTQAGTYNISTTNNGVTFAGSGTFSGTGCQAITLTGSGIPTNAGATTWTTNTTPAGTATATINAGTSASSNGTGIVSAYGGAGCTGNGSITGTMTQSTAVSGVYMVVYANVTQVGTYNISAISNGVTFSKSGTFTTTGCQALTLTGSGTPTNAGTITWTTNTIPSGTATATVNAATGTYPTGYIHCGTPTAVVEVTNPTTGKTWMDRNLGASQVATSSTDANAYGDLYQWGRFADGHQCRTSSTTSTLATSDTPGHGNFITNTDPYGDWRNPKNDNLWQGVNGINNPCPSGFRLPTYAEFDAERLTWTSGDAAGAFASTLKLTLAGYRNNAGVVGFVGNNADYLTSTVINTISAYALDFSASSGSVNWAYSSRVQGWSVRCIKN